MTRAVELLLISISFVIITLASSPAVATPTKVALTIEGDSSSIGIRKAVVGAFGDEDDVQFVSAQKTIEQLGIGEVTTTKQAKTVAKKLDVKAVVQGAFDESAKTLTLTIFNGSSGSSFTLPVGDAKSAKFKKAVRKKMLSRIAAASTDDGEDEEAEAPAKPSKSDAKEEKAEKAEKAKTAKEEKIAKAKADKEEKAAKAKADKDEKVAKAKAEKDEKADKNAKVAAKDDEQGDEESDKPAAKKDGKAEKTDAKKVAAKDEDEEDEEGDEDDAGADEEEPPGSLRLSASSSASPTIGANTAAIRIDLGASMMGRSLKFATSAVDGAPSTYRAKPQPGGHLAAEIYPTAVSNRSRLLAVGIGGDYDQATSFTAPATDGSKLKVKERSYSVGLRLRLAFGHRPTAPTVTIGAGYGVRTFGVDHDSGMPTGVPDVNYKMIDPGLTLRVPVGKRVALFAGGRGLLLLSAGHIAEGDQYGRAHVTGETATAGVDIVFSRFVALRIAGEGTQVDMKFAGQGMLSTMLDGDPTTIDVQSARDRYYGGQATLAVMY